MNQNLKTIGLFTCAALAMGAIGCGGDTAPGEGDEPEVVQAPDFPEGTGQPAWNDEAAYPAATGFDVGAIIPNFKFLGYSNYKDPAVGGELKYTQMADYYNPTGDGVFPEGHVKAGQPKPKAIVVLISSVWCPPCQYDAAEVLPGEYSHYQPMGGDIMSVLIDGPTPGDPATIQHVTNWANTYLTDWSAPDGSVYSLVMDPEGKIMNLYEPAFPSHIIVRTSDMRIMNRLTGVAQPGGLFWQNFEGIINGTITDPIGG